MHNLTICRTPRNNGPDDSAHFPHCAFNSADPSHLLPIVQSPPSDHTGSHQPRYISAHPSPTQVTTTMPLPYLAPEIIAHIIGNHLKISMYLTIAPSFASHGSHMPGSTCLAMSISLAMPISSHGSYCFQTPYIPLAATRGHLPSPPRTTLRWQT